MVFFKKNDKSKVDTSKFQDFVITSDRINEAKRISKRNLKRNFGYAFVLGFFAELLIVKTSICKIIFWHFRRECCS